MVLTNAKTTMRILLLSILTCGALFSGRAADVQRAAKTNAPCPGCVNIFNGENFEGWEAPTRDTRPL